MGCNSSTIDLVIADDPSLLALSDCFKAFQITPSDLHQFKKCFQKIDATKDGIYVCAHTNVYIYIHMYVCIYIYMYMYLYVYTYIYIYIYVYICIYILYMYICIYICMYLRVYIHICA
jgi:hypothetical protein